MMTEQIASGKIVSVVAINNGTKDGKNWMLFEVMIDDVLYQTLDTGFTKKIGVTGEWKYKLEKRVPSVGNDYVVKTLLPLAENKIERKVEKIEKTEEIVQSDESPKPSENKEDIIIKGLRQIWVDLKDFREDIKPHLRIIDETKSVLDSVDTKVSSRFLDESEGKLKPKTVERIVPENEIPIIEDNKDIKTNGGIDVSKIPF